MYFKPESVDLAISMLDETSLRGAIGSGASGPVMRVQRAEFPTTSNGTSSAKGKGKSTEQLSKETPSNGQRRNLTDTDRKKIAKRVARLETKLSDWRDDSLSPTSDTAPNPLPGGETGRTVVLTKMFTLHELDSDPTLLLDLKHDVREECEAIGGVTNVVLWDREPEGIITVKFQSRDQAEKCVRTMKGRFFAQRRIDAWVCDGKPRFRRSGAGGESDEEDREGGEEAQGRFRQLAG